MPLLMLQVDATQLSKTSKNFMTLAFPLCSNYFLNEKIIIFSTVIFYTRRKGLPELVIIEINHYKNMPS